MKVLLVVVFIFPTLTFAKEKMVCRGSDGKREITLELTNTNKDPNQFEVVARMEGKAKMTGIADLLSRLGVYEGSLTEVGDPLEFVLVFKEQKAGQKTINALLKLEDGEEISDFNLNCLN